MTKASRMLARSRLPIAVMIERQRAKIVQIDERLGRMMSRRADEEEALAELLALQQRLANREGSVI